MWKNRLIYLLFFLAIAVMVFFYYKPMLLGVLAMGVIFAILMRIYIQVDSGNLQIRLSARDGGQVGQEMKFTILASAKHHFIVTRRVWLHVDIENVMFHSVEHREILLELNDGVNRYDIPMTPAACGLMQFHCKEAYILDFFSLFRKKTTGFKTVSMLVYPAPVDIQLEVSRENIGRTLEGGYIQNRKGTDQSEIFDIREYVPGDDIRSIHWKLSCKTDTLILRQASDQSHYQLALLPDLGLVHGEAETSLEELDTAAALTVSIAESLVRRGTAFCMLMPSKNGLDVYEIRSGRDLEILIPRWLSLGINEQSGIGLRYFMTGHLEQNFSRLLILSAGRYYEKMNGLDKQIAVSVVSAVSDISREQVSAGGSCEIIEIPADAADRDSCRIVC